MLTASDDRAPPQTNCLPSRRPRPAPADAMLTAPGGDDRAPPRSKLHSITAPEDPAPAPDKMLSAPDDRALFQTNCLPSGRPRPTPADAMLTAPGDDRAPPRSRLHSISAPDDPARHHTKCLQLPMTGPHPSRRNPDRPRGRPCPAPFQTTLYISSRRPRPCTRLNAYSSR